MWFICDKIIQIIIHNKEVCIQHMDSYTGRPVKHARVYLVPCKSVIAEARSPRFFN